MTERHPNPASLAAARLLRMPVGPTGHPLTRDDLPPPNTKRWVIRRKAEVVAGVRAGLITLEEACRRYSLSIDEFVSWQHQLDAYGLDGLRATRGRGRSSRGGGAAVR